MADDFLQSERDRRELHTLVLRYARCADRRDYKGFMDLFTEDAKLSGYSGDSANTEPTYLMEGRDVIVPAMKGLGRFAKTLHRVANHLVELDGDEAAGETYCMAHHIYNDGQGDMNYTMAIRYQDHYRRDGGAWRFSARQLQIDWERRTPLGPSGLP